MCNELFIFVQIGSGHTVPCLEGHIRRIVKRFLHAWQNAVPSAFVCIPNCICDEITIQWHIYDVCRTWIYIMTGMLQGLKIYVCIIKILLGYDPGSWLWKYAIFSYLLMKLHWKNSNGMQPTKLLEMNIKLFIKYLH